MKKIRLMQIAVILNILIGALNISISLINKLSGDIDGMLFNMLLAISNFLIANVCATIDE